MLKFMIKLMEKERRQSPNSTDDSQSEDSIQHQISQVATEIHRNTKAIKKLAKANQDLTIKINANSRQMEKLNLDFQKILADDHRSLSALNGQIDALRQEIAKLASRIPNGPAISPSENFTDSKAYQMVKGELLELNGELNSVRWYSENLKECVPKMTQIIIAVQNLNNYLQNYQQSVGRRDLFGDYGKLFRAGYDKFFGKYSLGRKFAAMNETLASWARSRLCKVVGCNNEQ
jgi:predicted RNase H-like nuclease (RuvC/YqgF family)